MSKVIAGLFKQCDGALGAVIMAEPTDNGGAIEQNGAESGYVTSTVIASAQTPFTIDNGRGEEVISLSPSLCQGIYAGGNELQFKTVSAISGSALNNQYSTDTRIIERDNRKVFYVSASRQLSMQSESRNCLFELNQQDGQVRYTSLTDDGFVALRYFVFYDIVARVQLLIRSESTPSMERSQIWHVRDRDRVQTLTIPSSEMFAILSNVSVYFSGDLYKDTPTGLTKVSEFIVAGGLGIIAADLALTADDGHLYPDGVSVLEISDGFSEGVATIEFNHDAVSQMVSISVLSHTSTVCEIRKLAGHPDVPAGIAHAICFAL